MISSFINRHFKIFHMPIRKIIKCPDYKDKDLKRCYQFMLKPLITTLSSSAMTAHIQSTQAVFLDILFLEGIKDVFSLFLNSQIYAPNFCSLRHLLTLMT